MKKQKKNAVQTIYGQASFLLWTTSICESLLWAENMILFIHYTCCERHVIRVNGLINNIYSITTPVYQRRSPHDDVNTMLMILKFRDRIYNQELHIYKVCVNIYIIFWMQ